MNPRSGHRTIGLALGLSLALHAALLLAAPNPLADLPPTERRSIVAVRLTSPSVRAPLPKPKEKPEQPEPEKQPDPPPPPEPEEREIDLGLDAPNPRSQTWLGFTEYLKQLAMKGEVEQAAFTDDPVAASPPPAPPAPPAPPTPNPAPLSLSPPVLVAAPPAEPAPPVDRGSSPTDDQGEAEARSRIAASGGEQPPEAPVIDAPIERPDNRDARIQRPVREDDLSPHEALPETPIVDETSQIVNAPSEAPHREVVAEPNDEALDDESEAAINADAQSIAATLRMLSEFAAEAQHRVDDLTDDAIAAESRDRAADPIREASPSELARSSPSRPPPPEPFPPQPAVAPRPMVGAPNSGARSDRESDPTSIIDVPKEQWQLGKPLAAHGLEIKPRRPDIPILTSLTAWPSNPLCKITFDRGGVPTRAQIAKSTGDSRIDSAIEASLYRWRAAGKKLDELRSNETVTLTIRLLINPSRRGEDDDADEPAR